MTTPVTAPATTRLFLGIPIPESVAPRLQEGIAQYPQYVERVVLPERWHLTLLFLGNVEHPRQYYSRLFKDMPQTFVPTISLTHMGRGLSRTQLWAFAHPTTGLLELRQQVVARLKKMRFPLRTARAREFTPHIHVADLFAMARGVGLADHPLPVSFTVPHIHLYRSTLGANESAYTIEGTITL